MWKKTDAEYTENEIPSPSAIPEQPMTEQAVIGSSLVLKGDVTGENDLLIQGQVEGKVVLKKNSVTVGRNGRVKADIYGKVIKVEGKVQGNLFGDNKIIINQSGDVQGNLSAPRVTLEDGAKFKGSVDMETRTAEKPSTSSSLTSSTVEKSTNPLVKESETEEKAGKSGLKLT
jgi:cytoskeletal protein CcmA (bactofilin family)